MPILDAFALDTDPNGTVLLRSVLETGQRGHRLELDRLTAEGDLRASDPVYRLGVGMDAEIGAVPIEMLAAAAG